MLNSISFDRFTPFESVHFVLNLSYAGFLKIEAFVVGDIDHCCVSGGRIVADHSVFPLKFIRVM